MKNLLQQTNRTTLGNVLSVLFIMAFFLGSFQGWGQIVLRGTAQTETSETTSVIVTKPVGLAVGDVMIATINQADDDAGELSNATLSGWQLVVGDKFYSSGNDEWWGTVLYKVATQSDVTAADFTFTGDSEGDNMQASIIAFSGVDQTNPIDVTGTFTTSSTDNTSLSANSITTTTNNAAVIMLAMVSNDRNFDNWIATSPTSLTELFDVDFDAVRDMGIGGAWAIKPSAGATGSGTVTLSGNARDGAILIALREDAQAIINNNPFFRSNVSGNWSSLGTWQMSATGTGAWVPATFFPTTNSNVTISDNHTVTLDVDATISTLSIATGSEDTNLNFNNSGGNKSLTVSGSVRIFAGTGSNNGGDDKRINIGSGRLNCASLRINSTANDAIDSEVLISTGTLNITGNIQMDGTAARNAIIFSDAGTLNVGGNFNALGDLITFAGSTVNYNGADQTARAQEYLGNVTLSNSGVKTFATSPTVNQVLSMEGTASVEVTTGVINYGSAATLKYNKPADYTATSEEWITQFTATGGIVIENTGKITNSQTVSVSSGISGSGTLVNTGTLSIEGTCTVTNLTASATDNTVNYTATTAGQTINIKPTSYFHLGLSGATIKNLASEITISGVFTSTENAVTLQNNANLKLKGNFTHTSGTISTPDGSSAKIDFTSTTQIGGQVYTRGTGSYGSGITFTVSAGGYLVPATATTTIPNTVGGTVATNNGFFVNAGGKYAVRAFGGFVNGASENPVFAPASTIVYITPSGAAAIQYLGVNFPTNGVNVIVENTLANGFKCALSNTDTDAVTAVKIANLTIGSDAKFTIPTGKKLTVDGNIVNNGTMRIEETATLLQNLDSYTNSGSGIYQYVKALVGSANGSVANGRFYYVGSPISGATSGNLAAEGNNRLFTYNEGSGIYNEIYDATTPLLPGVGYVFRGAANGTYTLSGSTIGNGPIEGASLNLTNISTGSKKGFNLISNPYPSYLNWSSLKTQLDAFIDPIAPNAEELLPTIWYRTKDAVGNMAFDTYSSVLNEGTSNNSDDVAVDGLVPPMQSFWVKMVDTAPASVPLKFKNTMRSHGEQGLHTVNYSKVRLNLSNGLYKDETLVVVKEDVSNSFDNVDCDKQIASATMHQLYCLEGSKKIVIDAISNAIEKDTVVMGIQIPAAGDFTINATEVGVNEEVYLEDKITGAYQNLKVNPIYAFTSAAGTFHTRFVLHFAPALPVLPGQSAATAIAMPTSNWPQCNNMTSEDTWHSFTATSEGVSIAVNTSSTDVVVALHDEFGNVISEENAVNGIGNETLNFFGLTAGQTYKVAVRNSVSTLPVGTYGVCVKSLKRGGCDFGAGPYSLCQYYKATWAGSSSVNYKFTFTATSGPAAGQTFTRTQNSNICVLSTITPALPYGSTYDVVISNIYNLTDGAGNTEQLEVPGASGCQVVTLAEPQTTLSASNTCNNGERFRSAVVTSMPWVCGANNWRWKFTEVNPVTMQTVGSPIEVNRGSATNHINLGSVSQLQNGKMYAVETAPIFSYTGTNYNYGPVQYMCIVKTPIYANVTAEAGAAESNTKTLVEDKTNAMVFVSEGNLVNIQLTNATSNTANRADIYDVTGKCVKSVRLVEGMNQVTLTEAEGIYMVRTTVGNQSETARVFIKN